MPDAISTAFSALADPTRRAILARLAEGEASVGELAAPFTMSMPAISKHLGVLERVGLITRSKSAQWRHCRLRPDGFRAAASWLRFYENFWTESLDRLAEHLSATEASGGDADKQARSSNATSRSNATSLPNAKGDRSHSDG